MNKVKAWLMDDTNWEALIASALILAGSLIVAIFWLALWLLSQFVGAWLWWAGSIVIFLTLFRWFRNNERRNWKKKGAVE